MPFVTGWLGENGLATLPAALCGFILLMAATACQVLQTSLASCQAENPRLNAAVGRDLKWKLSICIYVIEIGFAFVTTWASIAMYVLVAAMWFIPDRRFETALRANGS